MCVLGLGLNRLQVSHELEHSSWSCVHSIVYMPLSDPINDLSV